MAHRFDPRHGEALGLGAVQGLELVRRRNRQSLVAGQIYLWLHVRLQLDHAWRHEHFLHEIASRNPRGAAAGTIEAEPGLLDGSLDDFDLLVGGLVGKHTLLALLFGECLRRLDPCHVVL